MAKTILITSFPGGLTLGVGLTLGIGLDATPAIGGLQGGQGLAFGFTGIAFNGRGSLSAPIIQHGLLTTTTFAGGGSLTPTVFMALNASAGFAGTGGRQGI